MNSVKEKSKLSNLNGYPYNKYDAFICSASYEERCKSIPSNLDQDSLEKVFVCYNKDHYHQVGRNAESLFTMFGSRSVFVELNSSDQLITADNLLRNLSDYLKVKNDAKLLIDITTFRRQALLILLRVLRSLLTPENSVAFLYSPASEYSVGLKDEDKWLSKNIVGISSVLGYAGIMMPTRPIHLIILAGLEFERAVSLISEYEPRYVSVGYPDAKSSKEFKHYELNINKVEEIKHEHPNVSTFEFFGQDVEETKKSIIQQVKKFILCNNIVAPMNNKISTVASALVAYELKEVQIALATAGYYNVDNYSIPSDYFYSFEIKEFVKKVVFF
jgi:hypothetical protein